MPSHSTVAGAMDDLFGQYRDRIDDIRDLLENMMEELAAKGEGRMVEILEAAVTPTGLARAELGGMPGRVDSGTMRGAISHDMENDGDEIVASWGWLDEVLAYFLYQEHGDEVFGVQFEGMNALRGSYIEMREELAKRLGDLT